MPKRADNNEAYTNSCALSEVRMNSPMPEDTRAIYRAYPLDVLCDSCLLSLSLLFVVTMASNGGQCTPWGYEIYRFHHLF